MVYNVDRLYVWAQQFKDRVRVRDRVVSRQRPFNRRYDRFIHGIRSLRTNVRYYDLQLRRNAP